LEGPGRPNCVHGARRLARLTLPLLAAALGAYCGSHGGNPAAPSSSSTSGPREVVFRSGGLDLHGYLWEPAGRGPFRTVLYNHGSEKEPGSKPVLGAFFVAQGYAFFVPHRRGQGLSPGPYISDLVAQASPSQQNQVVVNELVSQADDVSSALEYLLQLPEIDHERVAVAGCSYGGIETLLAAERPQPLRTAVDFAGAAESWKGNPLLQSRLIAAADAAHIPVFFIQAVNDYDTTPSLVLSAEMAKVGKNNQIKIYPAYGLTAQDGHGGFCTNATDVWGQDVLAFLRMWMP